MAAREYQGAGGLRLHLDEPLSDEMRKQITRGHLVPVASVDEPTESRSTSDVLASAGADVGAGLAGGVQSPRVKPSAAAKVDDWRAYAVSVGMPEDAAAEATKKELQEHVQVVEDAAEQSGDGALGQE
ncbi:hypothetical protein OG384_04270 [Streptomyces sp. NBC_01324]|uniref:hypothetical protein n=1 Tax=Streptomyces sp. NBC_01324 TaxID=2903826 RepID=UPI002E1540A0|nr:hypothetical protein OG384_04270 [Streptomyces sp. NBC_01324]